MNKLLSLAAVLAVMFASVVLHPGAAAARAFSIPYAAFHPRGVTLSGIQNNVPISVVDQQISAAKRYWNADVVRLQVFQDSLVGVDGRHFSSSYFSYMKAGVNYALRQGLVVVINDQTEPKPGLGEGEPMPTNATLAFWSHVAPAYKGNPRVVFDLFNEPHIPDSPADWGIWQYGGSYQGTSYYGMQRVASLVRRTGAQNAIWVEGINWAGTLDGAGSHLLSDSNIVYTFHHPSLPSPEHTPSAWYRDFGYLTYKGVPVADGEFSNYSEGYCWPDAPTAVPAYLRYLASHHVGVTTWTLGISIVGKWSMNSSPNLSSATVMRSDWHCGGEDQGSGSIFKRWFAQRAGK